MLDKVSEFVFFILHIMNRGDSSYPLLKEIKIAKWNRDGDSHSIIIVNEYLAMEV